MKKQSLLGNFRSKTDTPRFYFTQDYTKLVVIIKDLNLILLIVTDDGVLNYENFDLTNLFTPVKADQLEKLLISTQYDKQKTEFLIKGFKKGFDLGYRGPKDVKITSPNLKFTIGDEKELWNKVMKEVREKRYAGPFKHIPFKSFIQSPIGLVPKDGGKKTRLIFHLSYPRNTGKSVNENTPKELTTVEYKNFDDAIRLCLKVGKNCHLAKSDLTSAFRHICMAKKWWKYLIMKAKSPKDGYWYYFVDKCMPFGASISCAIFQAFSDALAHIMTKVTKSENINYLDDFFFVALRKMICDGYVQTFLDLCHQINFPVSIEKTFWGCTLLTFLGLLIDTKRQIICIPNDKLDRAKNMIQKMLNKKNKKTTLRELQKLCGFLNFLCKCIVLGRTFTRRLYTFGNGLTNPNHHLSIKQEMKLDLKMWESFLNHPSAYYRGFLDFNTKINSLDLDWMTDAAKKDDLGCGGHFGSKWFIIQWKDNYIKTYNPSINYLELYALTVSVLLWLKEIRNKRVTIFCDNMSVVHMVNTGVSRCKNCMVLLRIITMECLIQNVKISTKHIRTENNTLADQLSRMRYDKFRKTARKMNKKFENKPEIVPEILWPMSKLWLK